MTHHTLLQKVTIQNTNYTKYYFPIHTTHIAHVVYIKRLIIHTVKTRLNSPLLSWSRNHRYLFVVSSQTHCCHINFHIKANWLLYWLVSIGESPGNSNNKPRLKNKLSFDISIIFCKDQSSFALVGSIQEAKMFAHLKQHRVIRQGVELVTSKIRWSKESIKFVLAKFR